VVLFFGMKILLKALLSQPNEKISINAADMKILKFMSRNFKLNALILEASRNK